MTFWLRLQNFRMNFSRLKPHPSVALVHTQMVYFEIRLDFTDKIFSILK